jgi:hypothetical protein
LGTERYLKLKCEEKMKKINILKIFLTALVAFSLVSVNSFARRKKVAKRKVEKRESTKKKTSKKTVKSGDAKLVWDGGNTVQKGGEWVKNAEKNYDGNVLVVKMSGEKWSGGGIVVSSEGTDVSKYKNLVVKLKISDESKIGPLKLKLLDADEGSSDEIHIQEFYATAESEDGYKKVTIPLEKFMVEKEADLTSFRQLFISYWTPEEKDVTISFAEVSVN